MKTKFTLKVIFIFCIFCNVANAQTYTSVANGSWLNPLIWNPMPPPPFYVPVLGVNATAVIINTNVTVDTNYTYTSGTLTINSGKTLSEGSKQRWFVVNGGTFTNNGTFTYYAFGTQTGTATNNGTMNIDFVFYNSIDFLNSGSILGVDSLRNDKLISNTGIAHITASKFLNNKTIVNDGLIDATDFFNADSLQNNGKLNFTNFTNSQKCINDSLIVFNDFTNTGNCINNKTIQGKRDFLNWGIFNNKNNTSFTIARNFYNVDSSLHKAVFNNDGYVHVGHNWLNVDTVKGGATGEFFICDSTGNTGFMKGSFDFCDSTPTAGPPYIDLNTGTIDPSITYCIHVNLQSKKQQSQISVYPNPANNILSVEKGNKEISLIEIYDMLGSVVYRSSYINKIEVSQFPSGLYLISITDADSNQTKLKVIVEH